jgi:hypothetical protein
VSAFLRGRHAPRVRRTVPADGGSAWGDRETRDQWRTYVRRSVGLAVATVVATGLTVLAFVSEGRQDRERLVHATPVRGTVLDGGYGRKSAQDHVRVGYRFRGRTYAETLNGPGPDVLPRGRQVTVYVADDDPHSIRTRKYANHENSADLGLVALPMAAGGLLVGCVVAGWRASSWRRWLRRGPWTCWEGRRFEVPFYSSSVPALVLETVASDGEPLEVVLRLGDGMAWAHGAFDVPHDRAVLYRPGPGRRGVVMSSATSRPYAVLLPRSTRQELRWRSHLPEPDRAHPR